MRAATTMKRRHLEVRLGGSFISTMAGGVGPGRLRDHLFWGLARCWLAGNSLQRFSAIFPASFQLEVGGVIAAHDIALDRCGPSSSAMLYQHACTCRRNRHVDCDRIGRVLVLYMGATRSRFSLNDFTMLLEVGMRRFVESLRLSKLIFVSSLLPSALALTQILRLSLLQ